jgi:hypothetical protein
MDFVHILIICYHRDYNITNYQHIIVKICSQESIHVFMVMEMYYKNSI